MYVTKLKLINFRNYGQLEVSFDKNINLFYGDNAQGKTNILEALYFVACAKSHRTSKDRELIKFGQEKAYIGVDFSRNVDKKIDIIIDSNKKEIKINSIDIRKIGELIGTLNVVMFSPEDLKIIKEGPLEKRRFLDITNSQLKPSYFYNLQQYLKILHHRNALLKNQNTNSSLKDTINIWNQKMVEVGSKIIYHRYNYLTKLNNIAKDIHKKISNEEIYLKYIPPFEINNYEVEKIQEIFLDKLQNNINKDLLTGFTSVGPHRDNFEVYINNQNAANFGSQGQQRSAALSLKLAEVEFFKEEANDSPLLLLDDVMSELDDNRQKQLFEYIHDIQTFITCTSIESYKDKKCRIFNIKNAQISGLEE